jgi:hypothetical protein
MNWETIELGLIALVQRLSGLETVKENAERPFVTGIEGGPVGLVQISLFGLASIGSDASSWERAPGTGGWGAEWVTDPWASTSDLLEERVSGAREITLRCKVETFSQAPGLAAETFLSRIRDRIQFESSRLALASLNLGFQGIEAMTILDPSYDSRVFSAGALDMRLNATSYEIDSENQIPSIDRVIIKR